MRRRWRALLLGMPALLGLSAAAAAGCTEPRYRELDFWLGDWDVYDVGSAQPAARAQITQLLDGCVIHELYQSTDGGGTRGESFSIFDRSRGVWHQTWVTNRGRLLQIEGGPKDGKLVLAGAYVDDAGKRLRIRGAWWSAPEGVRERAETSADGGRTWKPEFDLVFRPRRPMSP